MKVPYAYCLYGQIEEMKVPYAYCLYGQIKEMKVPYAYCIYGQTDWLYLVLRGFQSRELLQIIVKTNSLLKKSVVSKSRTNKMVSNYRYWRKGSYTTTKFGKNSILLSIIPDELNSFQTYSFSINLPTWQYKLPLILWTTLYPYCNAKLDVVSTYQEFRPWQPWTISPAVHWPCRFLFCYCLYCWRNRSLEKEI
jgi:hypothetical protein